ncbi:hypothetical protein OEG84_18645 [Hoeflea sp. G2-23]|uniref:Uncharacterized protein n=1 Tax=Hoeflea algicola TaxID=2983763 RepID=A0ABT3ZD17_9HYPH|nr:hypothetical protein [Hoeflea algicola]MCY0149672.1 hypothetical protein [Hoeflea algicola]
MTSLDITTSPGPITFNPLRWRRWWLDIDRNEAAQRWAQTGLGQGLLHFGFIALMFLLPVIRTKHAALVAIALVLCAVFPARRMLLLTAVGAVYFLLKPLKQEAHYTYFDELVSSSYLSLPSTFGFAIFGLVFMAFAYLLIHNQTSRNIEFIARRPIQFMLALGAGLAAMTIAVPDQHPAFSIAWVSLGYLSGSFFFLGYILLDSRSKTALPVHQQLGFLRPVWAAGSVPLKGPAFFRKFEAKTPTDMAITRLKALKLVVWATILFWIWEIGFNWFVHGALELPHLEAMISATANGASETAVLRWTVLAADFLGQIVVFGASIHLFIAVIRMVGFNVPRGMAKPLASRTMSEFWSRYLFYFKEILADFFFYPTFQRCFKKYPRLRMAFATFMAAFVGNMLFDFISDSPSFAIAGFWETVRGYSSYAIYAGALTTGLIWSQLYQKKPSAEDGWFRYDVLPRVQVILFYGLLQVFDDSSGMVPVGERIYFFLSLFGVHT